MGEYPNYAKKEWERQRYHSRDDQAGPSIVERPYSGLFPSPTMPDQRSLQGIQLKREKQQAIIFASNPYLEGSEWGWQLTLLVSALPSTPSGIVIKNPFV